MKLKSLKLKNFKSIGAKAQTIEFKPITLLFGPNSSGKSTIVQALHYLYEILERNNCDPGTTHLGGKLDLGGFRNIVHLHDINSSIEISLGLSLGNTILPANSEYSEDEHIYLGEFLNIDNLMDLGDLESAEVTLEVRWSQLLNTAYVAAYHVSLDNECFASISCSSDAKSAQLTKINYKHSNFSLPINDYDNEAQSVGEALESCVENITYMPQPGESPAPDLYLQVHDGLSKAPLFGHKLFISPPWNKFIESTLAVLEPDKEDDGFGYLTAYLERAISGPAELVRICLKQFLYLGPLREIPGRNYQPELSPGLSRWASGLGAWDQIFNEGEKLVDKINEWMANDKRLDSGYELHYSEYKPLDIESPLLVALRQGSELLESQEWINEQLDKVSTGKRTYLKDLRLDIELNPEDLGTGISQVLPVLVAVLGHTKHIVAIEQPELHVHPKFQVELGDLFAHAVGKNNGRKDSIFILETHSEYMMLRLLRRLYETANDELEPGAPPLFSEDIAVYYVNPDGNDELINHLRLTKEGEFLDRWPNGFFPERKKELF